MKLIISFLLALPEIIKLLKNIEKQIAERKEEKDIKQGLKKINEAFENQDSDALNDIFRS